MDYFEQTVYWLLAGSKGASNRLRIIEALEKKPTSQKSLRSLFSQNPWKSSLK